MEMDGKMNNEILEIMKSIQNKFSICQYKLAEVIGINHMTVNRWANGRVPKDENIFLLKYINSLDKDKFLELLKYQSDYVFKLRNNNWLSSVYLDRYYFGFQSALLSYMIKDN
jgi:DNA-binding XRE family transcriptional regulator